MKITAGEATREFYREQRRKQEQERIIKLLESQIERAEMEIRLSNIDLPDLLALIKGEK